MSERKKKQMQVERINTLGDDQPHIQYLSHRESVCSHIMDTYYEV